MKTKMLVTDLFAWAVKRNAETDVFEVMDPIDSGAVAHCRFPIAFSSKTLVVKSAAPSTLASISLSLCDLTNLSQFIGLVAPELTSKTVIDDHNVVNLLHLTNPPSPATATTAPLVSAEIETHSSVAIDTEPVSSRTSVNEESSQTIAFASLF